MVVVVDGGHRRALPVVDLRALQPARVVDVDGLHLAELLDATGPRLAEAVARVLGAAEGQRDLGADRRGVDVGDARCRWRARPAGQR